MRENRLAIFRMIGAGLAGMLLAILTASMSQALTFSECASCHGGAVAMAHHEPTNPNFFNPTICQECHLSISSSSECATCHVPTGFANAHHVPESGQTSVNCADCHKNADERTACSSCHEGIYPGSPPADAPPATRNYHHVLQRNLQTTCTVCHPEDSLTGACLDCHAQSGPKPADRQAHHTYGEATNRSCASCHQQIAAIPGCQGCHAHPPGNEKAGHHDYAAANSKPCADCHSGNSQQISGCADCHQGDRMPDHHTLPAFSANSCSRCHTSAPVDDNGCDWCHTYNPEIKDRHHADTMYLWTTYQLGCNGCHLNAGNPFLGLKTTCIDCHQNKVGTTGTMTRHHAKAPAVNGDCAACHQPGLVSGGVCEQCHGVPGHIAPPATATAHHTSSDYADGNCDACHGSVDPISEAACSSCHRARENVESRHHNMTLPGMMQQCSTCHWKTDMSSLKQDCAGCHFEQGASSVARHHGTASYGGNQCDDCHSGNQPVDIPCYDCHKDLAPSNVSRHHTPDGVTQTRPCSACHSTIELKINPWAESPCAGCHFASVAEFHHGPPLESTNYNCSTCHQSESSPDVCANCHAASPHHTTTWSQSGDCAHCHAVPSWASDRPAQAACRECHGTNMHDNGGPIQNYGACAACHNQLPYHPAPTRIPGYTGYGAGKRKFNMFWSKFSRKGEDISPNGDDLRDHGGDAIKNEQLTFSTKQISSNGKTYTVPYFTGMASSNLALSKIASASRDVSGYGAALAVDGNVASRWWARNTSSTTTQWLKVDLGTTKTISKVALRWHSYYATRYQIQISTDNSNWTTVFSNSNGAGGMETRVFTARSARYIRIYCQTASSSNGYSIYELEAYAK